MDRKQALKRYINFIKNWEMLYGEISIDSEIMSGAPVFAGTRVPIQTIFDYLEGGDDLEIFPEDFPSVSKTAAINLLEMAKTSLTSEKFLMKI